MGSRDGTPVPGVVLLDGDHLTRDLGRFTPDDERGLGCMPAGSFESPASWPVSTVYAIAKGAAPEATSRGDDAAVEGLRRAVERLGSESDLTTTP